MHAIIDKISTACRVREHQCLFERGPRGEHHGRYRRAGLSLSHFARHAQSAKEMPACFSVATEISEVAHRRRERAMQLAATHSHSQE